MASETDASVLERTKNKPNVMKWEHITTKIGSPKRTRPFRSAQKRGQLRHFVWMYVHVVITIVLNAFRPIYFLRLLVLSLRLGRLVTTAEAVDTPDTEAAGVAAAVGVRSCIGVAVSWTASLSVS